MYLLYFKVCALQSCPTVSVGLRNVSLYRFDAHFFLPDLAALVSIIFRVQCLAGKQRLEVSGVHIDRDGMPVLLPASSGAPAALLLEDMQIYQRSR